MSQHVSRAAFGADGEAAAPRLPGVSARLPPPTISAKNHQSLDSPGKPARVPVGVFETELLPGGRQQLL